MLSSKRFATFPILEMFIKRHHLPGIDVAEHMKRNMLQSELSREFGLGSFCKLVFLRKVREVLSLTVAMLTSFLDHSCDLLFKR